MQTQRRKKSNTSVLVDYGKDFPAFPFMTQGCREMAMN